MLLAASVLGLPACAPGKPCDSTTEVLDSVTMSNVVCGGYGSVLHRALKLFVKQQMQVTMYSLIH